MHNSKKVVIYLAKLENSGGIESHIFEFLEAFKSTGVKTEVVVLNMLMESANIERLKQLGDKIWYTTASNKLTRLFWFIKTCIVFSCKDVDALYTNGQGGSFWFFSRFVRFKKWVHHHHTSGDAADQATWGKSYKKVLLHAHEIVACSLKNAGDIQQVIKRPVISIPCFSRRINPVSIKKNSSIVKFGYYGRLIPEKGIDTLIALSKDPELENIEFHIWGSGWAYDEKSFLGLNKFFYHGTFNSREELVQIISQIDGYLLISHHPEGLPISLLEVMSAGLPWLATEVGGIPDIVCDPLSTRMIPMHSDYSTVKKEIILFANDIRNNVINADSQRQLYNSKFDSVSLTTLWRGVLNV